MTLKELSPLKSKPIMLTMNSGAKYSGFLSGLRRVGGGKILLTRLQIYSKGLDYPIVSGSGETRNFWVSKIQSVELIREMSHED